jgi:U3 small nucleolar RNA-associated protein 21
MGKPITSMAALNESVFAAAGNMVGRYVRGQEVGRFVTGAGRTNGAYDDSESSGSHSSSSASSSSASSSSSNDSDSDDDDDSLSPIPESLDNLVLFGNTLVALSSTGRRMYVWDVPPYTKPASKDPLAKDGADVEDVAGSETDEEEDDRTVTPYATLEFPTGFTATKVIHPASYLNKVVVGSKEGELAVWNVRTGCVSNSS